MLWHDEGSAALLRNQEGEENGIFEKAEGGEGNEWGPEEAQDITKISTINSKKEKYAQKYQRK